MGIHVGARRVFGRGWPIINSTDLRNVHVVAWVHGCKAEAWRIAHNMRRRGKVSR